MQSNARKMSARLVVDMVKLQLLMGEKNMRWQGEIQGVIFVSAPIPLGLILGLEFVRTLRLGLGLGNKRESTSKKVFLYRSKSSTIKAP